MMMMMVVVMISVKKRIRLGPVQWTGHHVLKGKVTPLQAQLWSREG
jgi:hypothetical protein